jgi:hypothetical protein
MNGDGKAFSIYANLAVGSVVTAGYGFQVSFGLKIYSPISAYASERLCPAVIYISDYLAFWRSINVLSNL